MPLAPHRARRSPAAAPVLAALLVASGCGGDPSGEDTEQAATTRPTAFAAADPAVPAGWRARTCRVTVEGQAWTVRLALPAWLGAGPGEPGLCRWGDGLDAGVVVQVGPAEPLAAWRRRFVDPYVGGTGDDGIATDVTYSLGTPEPATALGGGPAEALSYSPFNDGLPQDVVLVQSHGVRVLQVVPRGRGEATAARRAQVLASLSLEPGTPSREAESR